MGAYKAYECDSHGAAPEEARAATSSGMTKEHTPECDDCLRKGDILSRGHVTVKSLISTKLSADVLDGVSMAKAAVISNALQQNLPGELRKRCEEEARSSSALADLVEQVFGVRTFRLSAPKRLSTPCLAEAQMPHADDFCNRSLVVCSAAGNSTKNILFPMECSNQLKNMMINMIIKMAINQS